MSTHHPRYKPRRGLSLRGLETLATDAGGRGELKTTHQIKTFILNSTRSPPRSYADALSTRPDGAPLVGPANVFVSHCYDYRYVNVLDALASWETRQRHKRPPENGPFFYYFDVAVVDQQAQSTTKKVAFDVLRDEFGESVASIGHTVLVLTWPHAPALKRAWVIFEVASTLLRGCKLDIAMPPDDDAVLCKVLTSDFNSVEQRLCNINTDEADATEKDDLRNIRLLINEKLGGFGEVNELVLRALREWVLDTAQKELQRPNASLADDLAVRIGDFMRLMGKTELAKKHLGLVLDARKALLAGDPTSRARTLDVAEALSALGSTVRLADGSAIEMLQRARTLQEKLLLADDNQLMATLRRLGVALKDASRFDDAAPLYERVYEHYRKTRGDDDRETLFAHLNLAILLDARNSAGDRQLHDEIVRDVAARRSTVLGERHPHTLFARHRLGLVLLRNLDYEAAGPVIEAVYRLQKEVCGAEHKETLSSRTLRARLWGMQGRLEDARQEYEDVRDVFERKIGLSHVETIRTSWSLAKFLEGLDIAAASREYVKALRGLRKNEGGRSRFDDLLTDADRVSALPGALAAELVEAVKACKAVQF